MSGALWAPPGHPLGAARQPKKAGFCKPVCATVETTSNETIVFALCLQKFLKFCFSDFWPGCGPVFALRMPQISHPGQPTLAKPSQTQTQPNPTQPNPNPSNPSQTKAIQTQREATQPHPKKTKQTKTKKKQPRRRPTNPSPKKNKPSEAQGKPNPAQSKPNQPNQLANEVAVDLAGRIASPSRIASRSRGVGRGAPAWPKTFSKVFGEGCWKFARTAAAQPVFKNFLKALGP